MTGGGSEIRLEGVLLVKVVDILNGFLCRFRHFEQFHIARVYVVRLEDG